LSIVSFFGLIFAWVALPGTTRAEIQETAPTPVSSPQIAAN
jgi:hypothetical protein